MTRKYFINSRDYLVAAVSLDLTKEVTKVSNKGRKLERSVKG